jgi:aspartate-semialdehyde dehydrogenase
VALASRRSSIGTEVSFGDRTLKVKALEHYDFSDTDICLMSAGGAVSKEWSPKIGASGLRRDRQLLDLAHATPTCRWSCRR